MFGAKNAAKFLLCWNLCVQCAFMCSETEPHELLFLYFVSVNMWKESRGSIFEEAGSQTGIKAVLSGSVCM